MDKKDYTKELDEMDLGQMSDEDFAALLKKIESDTDAKIRKIGRDRMNKVHEALNARDKSFPYFSADSTFQRYTIVDGLRINIS